MVGVSSRFQLPEDDSGFSLAWMLIFVSSKGITVDRSAHRETMTERVMKPIRCFSRLISPQRSAAILKGLGLPVIKGSQHNRIMFSGMKIHWTCLLFGSAATALGAGPDWPQFMGPHRNGSTQAQAIQDDWRNHPPKKLWSLEMGSGFSGPVIKDNHVFLYHRLGRNLHLDCITLDTGKQVWQSTHATQYRDRFGFDDGPRATPAIDGDRIFLMDANGWMRAFHRSDGHLLWEVNPEKHGQVDQGFFGKAPSPLVYGDTVVYITGGSPEAGIMALDVHDGSLIWKTLSEEADYASPVLQQTSGQWWIWAWMRDHVHHIHAATGKVHQSIRWRSSMNAAVNAATPLILPEGVFLSASYGTGALLLSQRDGNWSPLWSGDQQMSNHYAHCVYHQGYLYGFHGRQEQSPELRCIEAKSGKVAWSQANLGAGSLILADDRLLLMMESGEWILAEATPDRWSELGRRQILPSGVRASPALAHGIWVAKSPDRLVAYQLGHPLP